MDQRYELFGGLRVLRSGAPVALPSKTQRRILTALLLEGGRSMPSERLIDSIWGEDVPTSGDRALHFHMSKLRDTLEPDRAVGVSQTVETTPGGYRLMATPDDIDVFAWMAHVDEAADRLDNDAEAALHFIEELRSEYREPIPEFAYEDFAQEAVRQVQRQLVRLDQLRVDALTAVGRTEDATGALEALHERNPYDEGIVARLVTSLYRSGRQADALRTYDRTRERLVDELGIDPSPELEEAHLRVLQHDPHLMDDARSGVPTEAPHNLPADPLPLVGRDIELAEIASALAVSRLVSLTGVSGIGKSRIARAWARRNRTGFPDGIVYLNVGRMAEGSDFAAELAAGLAEATGRALAPVNATAFVANAKSLVLLDDATGHPDAAAFVHRLLSGDRCRVLTTTDDPSGVNGPTIAIGPLEEASAIELFELIRTTQGRPGDSVAHGETIAAAAGVPAGIVAAASAMRLGDQVTASRLAADTVGGLVAGSIALASAPARSAVRDLSQFHCVFGLPDARRVLEADQLIEVLCELLDRGLLSTNDDGLDIPPSTRLATGRLEPVSNEAATRYVEAVLGWTPPRLVERSADTESVLERLAADDPERAASLLGRVAPQLWDTGRHAQMLAWCGIGLRPDADMTGWDVERALYYAAHAALAVGARDEAERHGRRHAGVAESLGGPALIYSHLMEADIAWYDGQAASADDGYQRAARLASNLEHPESVTALFGAGVVAANTGRYDDTSASADYVIAAAADAPSHHATHLASELLGLAALGTGDVPVAIGYFTHALESPSLITRVTARRRLTAAHLTNGDPGSAAATWASIEDDLRRAIAPADAGVAYTGALLHHELGDAETAVELAAEGARLVIDSPAAVWVSTALAATAIIDSNPERRRLAADLVVQHAGVTGLVPLPPLRDVLDAQPVADTFDLRDVLDAQPAADRFDLRAALAFLEG